MMWNLLANSADSSYRQATPAEIALYAGLGFLIVFVGIALLIFVVWAVGKMIGGASKSNSSAEPAVDVSAAKSETPLEVADDGLSDEVIAVITAAIAAYYQQQHKKCEFTVKRIKRL